MSYSLMDGRAYRGKWTTSKNWSLKKKFKGLVLVEWKDLTFNQVSCISWLDTIAANLPSFDQIFQGVDDKSMYGKTMALMEIVSFIDWCILGGGGSISAFQFVFPLLHKYVDLLSKIYSFFNKSFVAHN
jgi:hypothetical protein